jgi:hypothetical protein
LAQYDSIAGSNDLFLELQANNVQGLSTKIGAPLIAKAPFDRPIHRLQPELDVGGRIYIMLTQHIFSMPTADLKDLRANLVASDYRITSALDLLFHGI